MTKIKYSVTAGFVPAGKNAGRFATIIDFRQGYRNRWGEDASTVMNGIVEEIMALGLNLVYFKGDLSLINEMKPSIEGLANKNFSVVIETNGTEDISNYRAIKRLSFVMNVDGGAKKGFLSNTNIARLTANDEISVEVNSVEDFENATKLLKQYGIQHPVVLFKIKEGVELDILSHVKKASYQSRFIDMGGVEVKAENVEDESEEEKA